MKKTKSVAKRKPAKPSAARPHVGPGKKAVSVYFDEKLHDDALKRATALGMSFSKYVHHLAKKDVEQGGAFTIAESQKP